MEPRLKISHMTMRGN